MNIRSYMVVKFLSSAATFSGVDYNTTKMDQNRGELMKTANFGLLRAFTDIRPQDYKHFLKMLSSRAPGISEPQLHVTISTKGRNHDKYELTEIAEKWLKDMGYDKQPYLIIHHSDTPNNHVHIVTSRVDYDGKKINDRFEWIRGILAMHKIMGVDERRKIDKAKAYKFSTVAQFNLLLEKQGFIIKDKQIIYSGRIIAALHKSDLKFSEPDKARAHQLRAIFQKYRGPDLELILKNKFGVELVFHSKNGQPAYGYTVIDHAQKNVFKGSEIMRLNELLNGSNPAASFEPKIQTKTTEKMNGKHIQVSIANDIDDDAIHGPRRKRKKKARTNLR